MNKYKINPHKKIISRICPKFPPNCNISEVIITPEIKQWQIFISSTENISEENLRDAEKSLAAKYEVDAKIIFTLKEITAPVIPAKNPAPAKNIKQEKNLPPNIPTAIIKFSARLTAMLQLLKILKTTPKKLLSKAKLARILKKLLTATA